MLRESYRECDLGQNGRRRVSAINLASNAAVAVVTTMLAAEASESVRSAGTSRELP